MKFGEYLREMRKKKNYKTNRFADMLDISSSYLSSLESGSRTAPSFEIIKRIADNLELNIEERHKLYDLAAESKKPPTLADDLSDYIINTQNLRNLLRYTMRCQLSEEDWRKISAYVKRIYFY